ncbi:hypothetical protein Tco_1263035 [Tanacetum coccineum]
MCTFEVSWNPGCKDLMRSNQGQVWRKQIIKDNAKNHSEAARRVLGKKERERKRENTSSHTYHEGEKILKEDRKESEFQWQRNYSPRRVVLVETPTNSLVVQDGIGGYDWSFQAKEGITNFPLMVYTSQGSSSSDSEVHTCSKDCLKSYQTLQKQYDQQREALNKSNLEVIGYQMGLESLEARIVVHEKNEVVYEEDITFLKYDVQVKDISIKDLKNQLEEALKEKDDLKLKLEKFEESSKNLTKLINS